PGPSGEVILIIKGGIHFQIRHGDDFPFQPGSYFAVGLGGGRASRSKTEAYPPFSRSISLFNKADCSLPGFNIPAAPTSEGNRGRAEHHRAGKGCPVHRSGTAASN